MARDTERDRVSKNTSKDSCHSLNSDHRNLLNVLVKILTFNINVKDLARYCGEALTFVWKGEMCVCQYSAEKGFMRSR